MNRTRVPRWGGVVVLVYVTGMLAACSDDPTGPVTEPAFDPSFAVEAVYEVLGDLELMEVQPVMGNIAFALYQEGSAPVAGAVASLPGVGSTWVFDEAELRWRVDPERTGAPEDGVRFVWYVMDRNANTPVRPLHERGWVDLRLDDGGESESVMTVTFALLNGGVPVDVVDYSITYQADESTGSFSVMAEGTAGVVDFDIERSFTYGPEEGVYEALVTYAGEAGLLAASVEAHFDPVTRVATEPNRFVGSVLTEEHYLLIEAGWEDDSDAVGGSVEADDEDVLDLTGTVQSPVFRLPTGGIPDAGVQADVAEVWGELWSMIGDGVSLIVVLENLYR